MFFGFLPKLQDQLSNPLLLLCPLCFLPKVPTAHQWAGLRPQRYFIWLIMFCLFLFIKVPCFLTFYIWELSDWYSHLVFWYESSDFLLLLKNKICQCWLGFLQGRGPDLCTLHCPRPPGLSLTCVSCLNPVGVKVSSPARPLFISEKSGSKISKQMEARGTKSSNETG